MSVYFTVALTFTYLSFRRYFLRVFLKVEQRNVCLTGDGNMSERDDRNVNFTFLIHPLSLQFTATYGKVPFYIICCNRKKQLMLALFNCCFISLVKENRQD